ncbi:MAG TPA: hypothetical protein VJR48_16730 [Ktedonobacterales bacterium]|nr:hypothetical protein [Ktedonobacterales bacterium]
MGMWPTPTVTGDHNRKGVSANSGDGLSTAVKRGTLWPTPTATDAGTGRINRSPSPGAAARPTLALLVAPRHASLWSTPAAQDGKNATCPASQVTRDTLPGDIMKEAGQTGATGGLNPEWVEMLMGYPEGWTAIDDTPTSCRRATHGPRSEGKRSTDGNRRARRQSASPTAPGA